MRDQELRQVKLPEETLMIFSLLISLLIHAAFIFVHVFLWLLTGSLLPLVITVPLHAMIAIAHSRNANRLRIAKMKIDAKTRRAERPRNH